MLFIACYTKYALLSMGCFALSQIIGSCQAHSLSHSRKKKIKQIAPFISPLILGLCPHWWSQKHNIHHIFTNSTRLDKDIKHNYPLPLYPFLLLKWRIDSIIYTLFHLRLITLLLLAIHYSLIYRQRLIYSFVAMLVAGFYCALLFTGNHER